jgi:hypothetical protein
MIHKNFVVLDENCHWLKLMYLFLRHVLYILSPFLSFNLLLFSIMFFFCSKLSIFGSIILSLFILNASFNFTFIPISFSNHSFTPLSIFPLIPPIPVFITLFFLSLFSLCSIFSSINLLPPPAIFLLFLSFPLSLPLILSLAPASPLTAANSFLGTLFSSLIHTLSSLISLIMVFISLSISLLLFPSSLLLGNRPVLELFLNGFVLSSVVLTSSFSLLLFSFLTFGDFGMHSLSCPLPSAYHPSLTRRCLR